MPSTPNYNLTKPIEDDYYDVEIQNENMDKIDTALTGHKGRLDNLEANNSANDNRIGDRTISDTTAPTGNAGKITTLFGWLAYMIKAITGKSSWRTAPATNLEAAKTHMDDTTVHITSTERSNWNAKETTTGAQAKADAAKTSAISAAATDATTKANGVQANLTTHDNNTTKHITASERSTWNAKASTSVATTSANGLMSKEQVVELGNKLDKDNPIATGTFMLDSRYFFKLLGTKPTISNSANQKMNLEFDPANFSGYFDVTVTGGYNTFNMGGALVRRFEGTLTPGGSLHIASRYINTTSNASSSTTANLRIGEITYNSVSKKYIIPIEFRTATASAQNISVMIEGFNGTQAAATTWETSLSVMSLTEFYADSVALPTPQVTYESLALTAPQGTAPLNVISNSVVPNLNPEFHNGWKIYNSITELGITVGTEKVVDIVKAMTNFSKLNHIVSSGSNAAEFPYTTGMLTIEKRTSTRLSIEFVYNGTNPNKKYYAQYNESNGSYSGWIPYALSDGTLQTNLNADRVDDRDVDTASTPSTVAARNASGYLTSARFISDVATGTSPLYVVSTTLVNNFNADMLDGLHANDFAPIAHVGSSGTAHAVATASVAGFMSATDKGKLDNVAAGANNYTHPSSHPASIITQDASNRFVTDAEKATWNAKAATASPALTGTPTTPTPALTTNSTQIVNAAFVQSKVPMRLFNSLTTPVGASNGDLWFPPPS